MKQPLVSIVTPLYNSEKYISETIESVLAQTYKNWEMIIVDDCSTDDGPNIVNDFNIMDDRVKYFKLINNLGAAAARNKAIKLSKGKYIAFLDSDDLWDFDKLEKQIHFMEINNYNFTYTHYKRFLGEDSNNFKVKLSPKKVSYKSMRKSCQIGCLTVVYNKYFIRKIEIPNLKKRNDYAIWLKILRNTKGYLCDHNLASYRIHDNNLSSGNKIKLIKHHYLMYRKSEEYGIFKSIYYSFRNAFYYLIGRR